MLGARPAGPPEVPSASTDRRRATQVELALADVTAGGTRGLTWFELGAGRGWHHGSASAVLSRLDHRDLIQRTTTYRNGSAAYRTP